VLTLVGRLEAMDAVSPLLGVDTFEKKPNFDRNDDGVMLGVSVIGDT